MAVNKVVYGGNTLIDLSSDTNAANKMLSGTTSHDKAGNPITGTIPSQGAQTITPGTADKTIASGRYLSGVQTIKGDANLLPENIKSGISIFDVLGTLETGGGETVAPTEILNDNTWDVISATAAAGQAQNYWAVGDTKQITINGTVGNTTFSSLTIWAFILGFNHNSAIEGNNTIHFQIGKTAQTSGIDICLIDANYGSSVSTTAGYFNMNYSKPNSGGWKSSKIRTTLLGNSNTPTSPLSGSMIAALPSDLIAVMKGVTKYSDNTGDGSDTASYVTSTTDYLWLLAEYEVFGSRRYANSAEQNYQAQYEYYANGNSKVKYKHSATSSTASWWLRSVNAANSTNFCRVYTSGGANSGIGAHYSYGVAPAFCI